MKVSHLFLKAINKTDLNNKGGKIQKCQTSTIFRSDTPRKVKAKGNGRNINSNFLQRRKTTSNSYSKWWWELLLCSKM